MHIVRRRERVHGDFINPLSLRPSTVWFFVRLVPMVLEFAWTTVSGRSHVLHALVCFSRFIYKHPALWLAFLRGGRFMSPSRSISPA